LEGFLPLTDTFSSVWNVAEWADRKEVSIPVRSKKAKMVMTLSNFSLRSRGAMEA
jgi:hypothetical protein